MSAPQPSAAAAQPTLSPIQLIDRWDGCGRQAATLLRSSAPDAAWLERYAGLARAVRALALRDADAALYLLVQRCGNEVDRYSAHHSLVCAVVCELCARWMEWPAEELDALTHAALTMNLSMCAMQDALAKQSTPLTPAQRKEVDDHAARSAELLAAAGVDDPLWLEVVRRHHDTPPADAPDAPAPEPGQRLVQLLRRVDIYTAKLSRRAGRDPTLPALAARHACLDTGGLPDAIGATLLRVLGLYPPGSLVRLRSGEIAVVIQRGAKAHTPVVALLRRADGGLYLPPVRRDTSVAAYSVLRGVALDDVKVRLHHERVLSLA